MHKKRRSFGSPGIHEFSQQQVPRTTTIIRNNCRPFLDKRLTHVIGDLVGVMENGFYPETFTCGQVGGMENVSCHRAAEQHRDTQTIESRYIRRQDIPQVDPDLSV